MRENFLRKFLFARTYFCGLLEKSQKLEPPKLLRRTVGHIPWVPEVFSRVRRGPSSAARRLVFGCTKFKLWQFPFHMASFQTSHE